jgi:riboflavin synthase
VFTGLVQSLGRVAAIRPVSDGETGATRLEIDIGDWAHRPDLGASISVNGCCLTVAHISATALHFDVIAQTLAVTSLGGLRVGDGVNLEHAATPMTFLGGHIVLGHVDGLAEVVEIQTNGEWRMRLRLPGDLGSCAVDKGSIALDGVSLTIARVEDVAPLANHAAHAAHAVHAAESIIDVCLIPETLARTNLRARAVGDRINVEVDYMAKLVARQLRWMSDR